MTTEKTQTKMTLEDTMKQIELETEAKVIEIYKTSDVQLPKLASDGKTLQVKTDEHQIDILKNIMAEGAKKFEAAAGRQMSYSEMRQMFG